MTVEERTNLKAYLVHKMFTYDDDLQQARAAFRQQETAWNAFRLSIAAERVQLFETVVANLYDLLHLWD